MNIWGKMHLYLQRKIISTVIQILARYKRTSFMQDSADKHIPSKTSRTVSSVPWIISEIRSKIRRRNKAHAKAKQTGSKKPRSKSATLKREIKDDANKQHDLYVNNLVGDVKTHRRDFYRHIYSQKKDNQCISPLKRRGGTGITASEIEQAEEFNGQFTDVFNKSDHNEFPFLSRSAPGMDDIVVSNECVTKLLKGLKSKKISNDQELIQASHILPSKPKGK